MNDETATVGALLAAFGAAVSTPACDYYGREIVDGDTLRLAPWVTLGVPNTCIGADLFVVGQTPDGMVVVNDATGNAVVALPPESIVVSMRDGAPLPVSQQEWWGDLLAVQHALGSFTIDVPPFLVGERADVTRETCEVDS